MKAFFAAGAVAVLGTALGVRTVLRRPPAPAAAPAPAEAAVWGTGKVEAWRQAVVGATAPGRIEAILKEEGAEVRAGEPVAVLERGRPRAQLERAQAAERQARREAERQRRLRAARVASEQELEKAETDWDVAKAELRSAQAALDDAVVRAPFAGRVLSVFRGKGESVSAGTPLFAVGDLSALRVRAQIDELDVGRAAAARRARVWPDAWPGRAFTGTVVRHGGMLGARTQYAEEGQDRVDSKVLETEIRLPPDAALLPGMSAKVELLPGGRD